MEEGRPGKHYWEFMIKYALFILFAKFLFQLDCWMEFPDLTDNYTAFNVRHNFSNFLFRTGCYLVYGVVKPLLNCSSTFCPKS